MKKVLLLSLLFSLNSFSSVCTEYASLLGTLKLKDMLTAYGERYIYKEKDLNPMSMNPFTYKHICNKDEVEETLTYLKREHFRSCSLESIENSLDLSAGTLSEERVETLLPKFIVADSCSPKVTIRLEENFSRAVRSINKELVKNKSNITEVCHIARRTLSANYLLMHTCDE